MSSSENNPNSDGAGIIAGNDQGPLWEYVSKEKKVSETGGTWRFTCNFCHESRQGSYSRVRAHLLRLSNFGIVPCKKIPQEILAELRKMEDEYEKKKANLAPKEVPLSGCSPTPRFGVDSAKKRKSDVAGSSIARAFALNERAQLDQHIARMFYTGGLSFNLARNPHYVQSYNFAASHNLGGYVPPGYNKLRTTLLQQEKANIERLLQPIKYTWPQRGVTICSDGWSDPERRPLINFMATSGNGPMFLKAVNCFGDRKDKYYIADLMKTVIDEIGHQNVVQIVTDNAPNCKGAGELIEDIYPNIYWTPCVVHTLNLALKNICAPKDMDSNEEVYRECCWITEIHDDAIQIKNYIVNHTQSLAIYARFTSLKLLKVSDTRFASAIVMLKRLKLVKQALQGMVFSEDWMSYREHDQGRARFVKQKIVDDDWWDKVNYILDFTGPIYNMIRACDTDKPLLHLVYEMWDSMIEEVKLAIYKQESKDVTDDSPFFNVVHKILVDRWGKSNTPLHCLAHSLNPRFYSEEWLQADSTRVPPHIDDEISTERKKCFRRLHPDNREYAKILDEYGKFSLMSGSLGDLDSLYQRSSDDPKIWWVNFGSKTPLLQALAFRVLGQPTSSSCCERNWSAYSFIHSLKRNRLIPKRAEDLVFIHNNLRLLSRNNEDDEKLKMWDVGGDQFDNDNIGYLELAELSLDEPELENVFFSDNEDD